MSTKSTIILTQDDEHFYEDCSEYLETKSGETKQGIVLEFSKSNIEILMNDSDDLIIMLNNADSEIFKVFERIIPALRS